jgi:LysM repeat protein
MRRQLILLGSVGLNVVLLAIWLSARYHSPKLQSRNGSNDTTVSNVYHTHTVVRKQFFSWQELESADYQAYIANLRAIGCPEDTIRDIIVADVNQLYAIKRAEVPTPDQQWWSYNRDPELVDAANDKLAALEQERQTLLTTLLGPTWAAAEAAQATGISLAGPVLGELSQETKHSVLETVARSQQRTQAYLDAQKLSGKPADPVVLAKLSLQLRTELGQILNPAQLEEFLLRYSQSASWLRERLRGVQVSPDEFRTLFRVADPLEQSLELSQDSQSKVSLQSSATNQVEGALKNVLGPERYHAYLTTQEPAYQEAMATADDNGVANPKQILALYEVNRATLLEQQQINNNNLLTPEQKAAQLALVEQQQQTANDQILGVTPDSPPDTPATGPATIHLYKPEETVDMISQEYGVGSSLILSANPTLNFHLLAPGTPIRIPLPVQQ